MTLRFFLFLGLLLTIQTYLIAQHEVSARAGISFLDLLSSDNRGLNFEVGYRYRLNKWMAVGLDHGYQDHSNFPDFYQSTAFLENGINPKADEYIRNLSFDQALVLRWQTNNFVYINPSLQIRFFRIKRWTFTLDAGPLLQKKTVSSFSLGDWKYDQTNNRITEYDGRYVIRNAFNFGWTGTLAIRTLITNRLMFSIDARFNFLYLREDMNNIYTGDFVAIRTGLTYLIPRDD